MYALLYGREKDKHTAELIQKLPQSEVVNIHHCTFCHEKPGEVAIRLSQCGARRTGQYISNSAGR